MPDLEKSRMSQVESMRGAKILTPKRRGIDAHSGGLSMGMPFSIAQEGSLSPLRHPERNEAKDVVFSEDWTRVQPKDLVAFLRDNRSKFDSVITKPACHSRSWNCSTIHLSCLRHIGPSTSARLDISVKQTSGSPAPFGFAQGAAYCRGWGRMTERKERLRVELTNETHMSTVGAAQIIAAAKPGTETSPDIDVEEKLKEAFSRGWSVIVWNDPVNLMDYVVYVFKTVLKMNEKAASRHMWEVHQKGKSVVARETREKSEHIIHRLRGFGLNATLEQA
jgi:ATP-dependent Clp protease adaptor protein ClpS